VVLDEEELRRVQSELNLRNYECGVLKESLSYANANCDAYEAGAKRRAAELDMASAREAALRSDLAAARAEHAAQERKLDEAMALLQEFVPTETRHRGGCFGAINDPVNCVYCRARAALAAWRTGG